MYPVQEQLDLPARVDGGLLAPQLRHFAQDAHGLVGEGFEVGRRDARCCFGHGGRFGGGLTYVVGVE